MQKVASDSREDAKGHFVCRGTWYQRDPVVEVVIRDYGEHHGAVQEPCFPTPTISEISTIVPTDLTDVDVSMYPFP